MLSMGEYEWATTELASCVRKGGRWASCMGEQRRKKRKEKPLLQVIGFSQANSIGERAIGAHGPPPSSWSPPLDHVTRSFHGRTAPIASFPFPAIMPT